MSRWADQKISIAFVKMLRTRSMDDITVIEVCEKAGVNRQSFYYHFKDMGELLDFIIKNKLEMYLPKDKIVGKWPEQLEKVLAYSKKHRKIILNIYHSDYQAKFIGIIKNYAGELSKDALEQYLAFKDIKINDEEKEFLVSTRSMAFTGIYQLYIDKGLTEDPVKVSDWCGKVFRGSLEFIIEKFKE